VSALILDSGALVAVDRDDRAMVASIRPQEGSIKGWSVRTKTALEKRTDRKRFISRTTQ